MGNPRRVDHAGRKSAGARRIGRDKGADAVSLFDAVAAAYNGPGEASTPPVPYTSGYTQSTPMMFQRDDRETQLEMSTAESTLLSVLDLVSSKTAEVRWEAERVFATARPGRDRQLVTAEQSLAVELWEKPNDFMTGQFLRQLVTWHYDAVGEGWIVADKFPGTGLIRSLWPVRPDRMDPVTSETRYCTGYVYTGPNKEKIPLELGEVLRITRPNPWDFHRGLGLVQTLLIAAGTSLTAQAWIRAFFRNDARPGGVIELGLEPEEQLTDDEFTILKRRWNEDHDGVSRANRVGFLERGAWKDVQQSIKDMEYSGIRNLTRDQILEAFRIHKHSMGISEDVNRANATAASSLLSENTTRPRLDLWQQLANGAYRDLFGDAGRLVKFCYTNPSPVDPEMANAERDSKTSSYKTLIEAGVDPDDAAVTVGLPPMRHSGGQVQGNDARPAVTAA
jgi:phage portal protein BeeE